MDEWNTYFTSGHISSYNQLFSRSFKRNHYKNDRRRATCRYTRNDVFIRRNCTSHFRRAGASGYEGISGLPDAFVQLANGSFIGIPNLLWILIVLTVLCTILFHRTIYGRHVKLTGSNENAAKYTGIKTKKVVIIAYILSGLGGGLGGAFLTAYFGSARADMGSETILPIITAVVLGGTLITGEKEALSVLYWRVFL